MLTQGSWMLTHPRIGNKSKSFAVGLKIGKNY